MTTLRLYHWTEQPEPATAYSAPMVRFNLHPTWPESPEAQADRVAEEAGRLPAGWEPTLLPFHMGTVAIRDADPVRLWRQGVDREVDRDRVRRFGKRCREHGLRFGLVAGNNENGIDEDNPRIGYDLAAVTACWDAARMYPFTPADLCGQWGTPTQKAARLLWRDRAAEKVNDYTRWLMDTSNYLPIRAGRVCNWQGHGAAGVVSADGRTTEVVTLPNGFPIPAYRPGTVDSPAMYLTDGGTAEHHLRNASIIRESSTGDLIPWVSDAALTGTVGRYRYEDGPHVAEWHLMLVRLAVDLGVREFLWWSCDPDRARAHKAMAAAVREAMERLGEVGGMAA